MRGRCFALWRWAPTWLRWPWPPLLAGAPLAAAAGPGDGEGGLSTLAWVALLEGAAIATLLVLLVRSRAAASPEHRDLERLELLTRASARDELARLLSSRLGGPLASVVNNLGAARRLLASVGRGAVEAAAGVEDARASAEEMTLALRRICAMLSTGGWRSEPVDVSAVARRALAAVACEARRLGVSTNGELAPSAAVVRGDPEQLLQALVNLLLNGLEAAASGERRSVTVRTTALEGGVEVAVTDSGPGISETDRAHMFEPLFTSRPGHLGLGLAAARSIVEAHGGRIVAERPASGAHLLVTLPVERAAAGKVA